MFELYLTFMFMTLLSLAFGMGLGLFISYLKNKKFQSELKKLSNLP